MLDIMDKDMLELFFEDTMEMLDSCIDKVIEIEGNFDDEVMDEIMRIMHSIKGASSMIDLYEMENFSHKLEDMFIDIKTKSLCIENELIEIIIESLNLMKKKLEIRKSMFNQNYLDFNKELIEEKKDFGKIIENINKIININFTEEISEKNTCIPFSMSKDLSSDEEINNTEKIEKKYYKIIVFFDETADMFELKRIMLKNSLEEFGKIELSEPTDENIFDSKENIYKIILSSEKEISNISDIFDIGDIYFFSLEEMKNIDIEKDIDGNIKNSEIYLKKDLKYETVVKYYEKFKQAFDKERPKKIITGDKKKDIYGIQMLYMLSNEGIVLEPNLI